MVGCEGMPDNYALGDYSCKDTSFAGDFVSIHGFTAVDKASPPPTARLHRLYDT